MTEKDFNKWNKDKQTLDKTEPFVDFSIRQVWYIKMGTNVRFEQDGKGEDFLRPVLVFRKFNSEMFWGIPCTSKKKNGRYYYEIGEMNGKTNTVILSQLRLYSASRLDYQIGTCSQGRFKKVQNKIKKLIDEAY